MRVTILILLISFSATVAIWAAKCEITTDPQYTEIFLIEPGSSSKVKLGEGAYDLKLKKGEAVTLQFVCPNFAPVTREYVHEREQKLPDADYIRLDTRLVELTVTPADAEIYQVDGYKKQLLGKGKGTVQVHRKGGGRFVVEKAGYQSLSASLAFDEDLKKLPAKLHYALTTRVVRITANPYDAGIYVNGRYEGKGTVEVEIPENEMATVEAKREGYLTVSKDFYNQENADVPPRDYQMTVKDRLLTITAQPSGAMIYLNGEQKGVGTIDAVIREDDCIAVKVSKAGYADMEENFCNKAGTTEPPRYKKYRLEDKVIRIYTTPEEATIKVDGELVNSEEYKAKVVKNRCIEVTVEKEGFITKTARYCNDDNKVVRDPAVHFELAEDEAYSASVTSDQANVNFTVAVGSRHTESAAWKTISMIVMNYFDVLESSDKETGYIRTAWKVQGLGGKTIRTRVIVKLGDVNPLKYIVKINSEYSDDGEEVSVKDDERFKEWGRLLKAYQDIINEMQVRLK